MKKKVFSLAILALSGTMMLNSCIGSYALFNKFVSWETRATNSKFVNAILGFIITPVAGPICLLVDAFVLNTIEFWSGDNPMASNVGKTQQIMGQDGLIYAVKTLKNGYEVTRPNGQVVVFTYNKKQKAWYMEAEGQQTQLFSFNANGTITAAITPDKTITVTPDEQGLFEARMAAGDGHFFAFR